MKKIYSEKRHLKKVRKFRKYNKASKKKIKDKKIKRVQIRKQKLLNSEVKMYKKCKLPRKYIAKILFR